MIVAVGSTGNGVAAGAVAVSAATIRVTSTIIGVGGISVGEVAANSLNEHASISAASRIMVNNTWFFMGGAAPVRVW
jgi:hypothetical protein